MLNVTKAFLPEEAEYIQYLKGIWERGWLTNHGPLVCELEDRLKKFLGVKHLFFVNNGTIAIQIALKALEISGEVITTPFSYVATTSAIVWEGLTPVFADINPKTLCLDPSSVRSRITKKTKAILATHVYGTPCDVAAFAEISKEFNLPIVYDAAHAFGVRLHNKTLLHHGAISTLSFHATKVFHTCEGGGIVTEDDTLAHKISYLRNFGHNGPEQFHGLGINGKCSEFHAAMGLAVLKHIPRLISERRELAAAYDRELASLFDRTNGKDSFITKPLMHDSHEGNFSYYPILFRSEEELLAAINLLNRREVNPRRYFYPSLSSLPYISNSAPTPICDDICRRILCLPFFPSMTSTEVRLVTETIKELFFEAPLFAAANS